MESTPGYIPIKDYNARYRSIRKCKDILLGEASLLKDSALQRTVIVKEKEITTQKQLEEEVKDCETLMKLNTIPAFAQLYGYTYRTALVNKVEVCLFYEIREYFDHDLEKEVANRFRNQRMFTEIELWKMTQRTVHALAKLQNHNTYHGNIRPKTLLMTKDCDVKIHWTHYHPTSYSQVIDKAIPLDAKCVLAPEILDSYSKGSTHADYNPLFSDVFSLGMTLLYAAALGDIDDIYDWDRYAVKPSKLNYKLTWLKATFSERLYRVLERMLQIDPCTRADFQSVSELITLINHNGKDAYNAINLSSSGMLKTSPGSKIMHHASFKNRLLVENESVSEHGEYYPNIIKTGSPLRSIPAREGSFPITIRASEPLKRALMFAGPATNSNTVSTKQSIVKDVEEEEQPTEQERGRHSVPRLLKRTFSPLKAPNDRDNEGILEELQNEIFQKPGVSRKQYVDGSHYEGQFNGPLREGYGIYHYGNNGDIYAGSWHDDKFHGRGIYLFANGERYEGDLAHGHKHGKGVYYYLNKNKYMGDWRLDKKSGLGIFYFNSSNEVYDGEWEDGERQGEGTFYFSNGDKFVGTWIRGEKRGKGTIVYHNGARFEGEWAFNKPNGHGVMTYANGDKYDGSWTDGIKSGVGTYYYPDGSRYEGNWMNDNKEGHGVFTYSTNDKYTGQWASGCKHGVGVYEYSNGSSYRGEWQRDFKHGRGVMTQADQTRYDGSWENGEKSGKGILRLSNGDVYEGDFKNDLMHGHGKYCWTNGDVYDGEWARGMMHGEGVFKGKDGIEQRKMWEFQSPTFWYRPEEYSRSFVSASYI